MGKMPPKAPRSKTTGANPIQDAAAKKHVPRFRDPRGRMAPPPAQTARLKPTSGPPISDGGDGDDA